MAKQTIKLSELPFGEKIEIGGFDFEFKGIEKRKTQFGKQEHFVFYCEETKIEKIYEKYKFSTVKIKKDGDKYQW
jgi:hypothetical protein